MIPSIFLGDIFDHLLPSLVAEIHVDIGHGHTLRVQETLKQQIKCQRINIGDLQTVCDNTPGRRTTSRSHNDPLLSGIMNKIPHDQEIIYKSHILDGI